MNLLRENTGIARPQEKFSKGRRSSADPCDTTDQPDDVRPSSAASRPNHTLEKLRGERTLERPTADLRAPNWRLGCDGNGQDESLTASAFVPPVDIYEDQHSIQLKLEVPGIEEKDLDVKVENNLLTVNGERKFEKEAKEENFRRVERRYGMADSMVRILELRLSIMRLSYISSWRDSMRVSL